MTKILYQAQENYLNQFLKQGDDLLSGMEEFASRNNIPILSKPAADLLEQYVKLINPKRTLEIGTAIGYSTIRIARNLKKKSKVFTIEKSEDNIKLAAENFSKSGNQEKIVLLEGDALNLMPRFDKKFDLIFLDADKEDYKRLFDYSVVLLKKGGILFIDNLLWHGYAASKSVPKKYKVSTKLIREFNVLFTTAPNLFTTILPVGDGIGIGIKV
ncbi:MAG: O-methyltransferase [Ignavibacteriales bacterium]|nr:MAG: O-methyltransferase [Ignavibacteriales bacterium]